MTREPDQILVIDDDPILADIVFQMLESEGFHPEVALTGADGIEAFRKNRHELVMTDLMIGDMTGIDVLRAVREVDSQTPVIILTGYASTDSAMEAIRLGANDYMTKPVKMLDLLTTVKTQLSSVRLAKQVAKLNANVAEERDKLHKSVAELTLLKRLAERMMSVLSFTGGYEVILNLLVEETDADIAVIYDFDKKKVRSSQHNHLSKKELTQLVGIINKNGSKLFGSEIHCSKDDFKGLFSEETSTTGKGLVSAIVVSLKQKKRSFGLLLTASRSDLNFAKNWKEFTSRLSHDASEFLWRIKRSVEKQRHFAATIVEQTHDGIVLINQTTGEVLSNPIAREMLHLSAEIKLEDGMIGKIIDCDLDEIWHELKNSREQAEQPDKKIVEYANETEKMRQFFKLDFSVLPDEEGEINQLLIVIHDVTQERSVEEMKNRLISNITHEVRTPTAVIKEFASLILDGVGGDLNEAQMQYFKIMHSNIERLSRLIENLLTLARSDTGGFTIFLQPTNLAPIVNNVVSSMQVKLARKNITVSANLPKEMPQIYADEDAVTQILTNIVDNAFKYSPNDTKVEISAKVKGARIEVTVADQGYGIPAADKEVIFSRFHRLVDENDARFQEGVGLGLSLVKDLVVRHGGDIWVESEVGKGSIFFVSLPIATEDVELKPA